VSSSAISASGDADLKQELLYCADVITVEILCQTDSSACTRRALYIIWRKQRRL